MPSRRPFKKKFKKKRDDKLGVRKKKCRFCRSKDRDIDVDYKDVNALRKLTTLHGKIFSRKRSGNCTTHQRQLKIAVKRARFLSLL